MRKFTISLFIGTLFFSFIKTSPVKKNIHNSITYSSAVLVSESEFTSLTQTYQAVSENTTHGGQVSKALLLNLINSMPSSKFYVNFNFYMDPTFSKVSLMMMGSKTKFQGESNIICLRNGGSSGSFCPTVCELNSSEQNITLSINYNTYYTLFEQYKINHMNGTLGGSIEKMALLEVINSLPSSAQNVAFRFCTDDVFQKTSVIFVGGSENRGDNDNLYYRNGNVATSFCPTVCQRND